MFPWKKVHQQQTSLGQWKKVHQQQTVSSEFFENRKDPIQQS